MNLYKRFAFSYFLTETWYDDVLESNNKNKV
jgi:hypothetical protein